MILLAHIKKRIIALVLKREMRRHVEKTVSKPKSINKIGILMEDNEEITRSLSRALRSIGFSKDQLHFMMYRSDNGSEQPTQISTFSATDFSYTAHPHEKVQTFCDEGYDVLINYFTKSNPYLELASLKTQTKFRVGFTALDNRYNDLIFSLRIEEPKLFCQQMNNYLKLIDSPC